jgi:Ferritin-like domain
VPAAPDAHEAHATGQSALVDLRDDPSSRKRFLRALGGGAAAATLAAAIAACGSKKSAGNSIGGAGVGTAQFGEGDVGILNYALTLEYLETELYRSVVASGVLKGRALDLAKTFGSQEQGHVITIESTVKNLGGKPAPRPNAKFPLGDQREILSTVSQVETLGAGAYLGQIDRIQSRGVLGAVLAIHTVEARHAAAIAELLGQPISPQGAFAQPVTSVDVIQQIQPFLSG